MTGTARSVTAPVRDAGRREYRLLDGLRAIAALMVVGYHVDERDGVGATFWDGGERLNMGVTVFFVLSGFLLYRPFVAARFAGRPGPAVGTYLTRRVLRVVPAYWLALTVFGLALPLYVPVFGPGWSAYYLLGQTWVPDLTFGGLSPAWSLSVEASFYLLLPVVAGGLRRALGGMELRRQVQAELALYAVVVAATSVAYRYLFDRGEGPAGFLAWTILGHADWFAAGMALALVGVAVERGASPARALRFLGRHPGPSWLGAAAVFAAAGFVDGNPANVVHVMSLLVAVLLVVPAVVGDESGAGPVRRVLGSGPARWLGTVSYGIFLWNEPLASWFGAQGWFGTGTVLGGVLLFTFTVVAALAAGALSWYAVERPAMALAHRRNARLHSDDSPARTDLAPSTGAIPAAPGRTGRR